LREAVRQGKLDLVKALVTRGADLNTRAERPGSGKAQGPASGVNGLTPFLTAAEAGNVPMMKELIGLGADPKAISPDGTGAVLLAASSHKLDAVQMVVELGLNVNQAPKASRGALHTAVRAGADEMVEYLVDHGADLNAKDNFGRTPLEEAEFEAPTSTIELMRKLTRKP
jgi:ankyrin repeat protein